MSSTFFQTLQALRSPSEAVRERAMQALGASGDVRAAGFLDLALASEGNGTVLFQGQQALRALKTRIRAATPTGALVQVDGRPTFSLQGLEAFLRKEPLPSKGDLLRILATLCTLRSPQLREPLTRLLGRCDDGDLQRTILITLGTACGGPALSPLVRHLSHEDLAMRSAACDALFLTGELLAYPYFVGTLSDLALPVRRRSLLYLQWLGRENLLNLMRSMASSTRPWKREAVARGMGLFRSAVYVALLEPLLRDGEERVRKAALASLVAHARRGDEKARLILARSGAVSGAAAEASVEEMNAETLIGTPMEESAIPWPDLDAPDTVTRMEAVDEIARLRDEVGIGRLVDRVEVEEDERVLSFLLSAMGRVGDHRHLPVLRRHLKHPAPRIRANAVEAMARFLSPVERIELLDLLRDENNRVQATVLVALRETEGVDVIPPLERMLAADDPALVRSAIHAVSAIATEPVVRLLQPVLEGGELELSERARSLLESLAEGGLAVARAMLSAMPQAGQPVESAVDWGNFESGVAPSNLHPSQSGKIDWAPNLEKMTRSEVEAVLAGHERSKIYREDDDPPSPSEASRRVPSLVADEDAFEDLPSSAEGGRLEVSGPSTRIVAPKVPSAEAVRRATRPVDLSTLGDEEALAAAEAPPAEAAAAGSHCPNCGEVDVEGAIRCRFCGEAIGEDLTESFTAPPEESPPGPTRRVARDEDGSRGETLVERRERRRQDRNRRPGVVVALLLVDIVVGVLAVVAGLWMCMNREIPLSEAFLTILYGGASFFVGIQLFFGARWVRWVQGLLLVPPLARSWLMAPFALLVLVLTFLPSTKEWCRR